MQGGQEFGGQFEYLEENISAAMIGLQYLHPAEAAHAAGSMSAALLLAGSPASVNSTKEDSAGLNTAAASAIVSLASHPQPEVRAACYDSIAARAAALAGEVTGTANSRQQDSQQQGSRVASPLLLLLRADSLACIVGQGLCDSVCSSRAAEAIESCAQCLCTDHLQAPSSEVAACGVRLVEYLPRLMCHLELGSQIASACRYIRSWQQQQQIRSSPEHLGRTDSHCEGLRGLDLVHSMQQLFHKMPAVREAATARLEAMLEEEHTSPVGLTTAWNGSFEASMEAVARHTLSRQPLTPNLR